MSNYAYEAVDASGLRLQGSLDVTSQSEAIQRIKEMGLFPTRVAERRRRPKPRAVNKSNARVGLASLSFTFPVLEGGVKPRAITVFTRQLATLVEAGMPLMRGLRILQQQESSRTLKRIIGEVSGTIESGNSLSEALAAHPRVFNRLLTTQGVSLAPFVKRAILIPCAPSAGCRVHQRRHDFPVR